MDLLTAEVAAFRASEYRDCKSDDDLSCSQALNASFFARISSLTSWFHQDVLFSLSPATPSRFRPQLSAADQMIADLNSSHSFSMSTETSGYKVQSHKGGHRYFKSNSVPVLIFKSNSLPVLSNKST